MQMQPCNCTSCRSALSRLDAVMSAADSICFSSFLFSFQDLISIPSQSFRILSSFFSPHVLLLLLLCLLLDLLNRHISSGPSRSDGNDSKEADVTAKHPNDREEASCVVPLLPSSLFPEGANHLSLASCISDLYKPFCWSVLFFPLLYFSSFPSHCLS